MYEQNTENHTKPRVIYAKIRFAQNCQQIRKYAGPPKTPSNTSKSSLDRSKSHEMYMECRRNAFLRESLNSLKHTVVRKKHYKTPGNRVRKQSRKCNLSKSNKYFVYFSGNRSWGSLLTRFWGHQSSTLRPQEGPEGSQGPPRALRRSPEGSQGPPRAPRRSPEAPRSALGSSREPPGGHQETPRSFRWPP